MPDEFEIIEKYFAPLAGPGAFRLSDDAACIAPPPGQDLVLSADALIGGVHFRNADPPDLIARKALRVNLSDLAAKGARALGYLITIAWPRGTEEAWIAAFARGLAQDQAEFACPLLGGDTVSTPGPLSLSITVLGAVPSGAMLTRSGAKPGDAIFVSGTIGDGALGLHHPESEFLNRRYLLPEPRLELGLKLLGRAHAAMDVSDGLVADLKHLAEASGVSATLEIARVPLSDAARRVVAGDRKWLEVAVTGGDDYEILFTGPPALKMEATRIGTIAEGRGVLVIDAAGQRLNLGAGGWRHDVTR